MATPFIATVAIGTALDLRGFATGVAKLRSAASAANGPMGQTQGAASGLSRALGSAAVATTALSVAARAGVGAMTALGASITAVGRTASAVGLAFGLFGASILKTGFDWRKQWNQARAVTSGTRQEMEELERMVKELAGSTKFTMQEVASAVEFLGKAGNTASEQLQLLPTMLDLAAAAGTDLGRTADIMTNIAQGLNIPLSEVAAHGDMITATFLNSNVTLEHIGDSMKKLAPISAGLNLSFADMVTTIGLLGNAGIQASEAGVHMRRALTNLSDPLSKMRTDVINILGLKWEDIDVLTEGYAPVLMRIRDALLKSVNELGVRGFESSQEFGLASRIFGTRAVSTMIALLRQMGDGFDELNVKVRNSEGVMRDTAAAQLEGIEGFYRLQAAIANAKIAISESGVLDLFEDIANKAANMLNKFAAASDATKRLVFNIAAIATVAGPSLIGVGLIISLVAKFGQLALFMGSVVSFLLTPLGALVAAIFAVVGIAAYMATTSVESFQELLDGGSPLLEALANIVLGVVGAVSSAIKGDWGDVWAYAKDVIANVAVVIVMVMTELVNAMLMLFQNILGFATDHWEEISNNVLEAMDWIFTESSGWLLAMGLLFFGGFRNLAFGVIKRFVWMANRLIFLSVTVAGKKQNIWKHMMLAIFTSVKTWAKPVVDRFVAMYNASLNAVKGFFTKVKDRIVAGVKWIWGAFAALGKTIAGPAGIIKGMVTTVLSRLTGMFASIKVGMAGVAALLTNPWVAGILALTTAALLGVTYFKDELAAAFNGIFRVLGLIVATGIDKISEFFLSGGIIGKGLGWLTGAINAVFGTNLKVPTFSLETFGIDVYGAFGVRKGASLAEAFRGSRWTKELAEQAQALGEPLPPEAQRALNEPSLAERFASQADKLVDDVANTLWEGITFVADAAVDAFEYTEEALGAFNPLGWALDAITGDYAGLGQRAEDALKATVQGAWDAIEGVGKALTAGTLKVVGEGSELALKAALKSTGWVLNAFSALLADIKPLNDVDPEAIKQKVYQLLGGAVSKPELDEVAGFTAEEAQQGAEYDTPAERKQAAVNFVATLIDDIKDRLENLLPYQEPGAEGLGEEAVALLSKYQLDQAALEQLAASAPAAAAAAAADASSDEAGTGGADGTNARRYASLTGALKDINFAFRIFLGDQEIEDIVVEAIAQGVREDRLKGVSVT